MVIYGSPFPPNECFHLSEIARETILHDDFLVSRHQPHSQGLSSSFPLALQSRDEEGPWEQGCRNICSCVMKSSIHSIMLKFKTIKFENNFFPFRDQLLFLTYQSSGWPRKPWRSCERKGWILIKIAVKFGLLLCVLN